MLNHILEGKWEEKTLSLSLSLPPTPFKLIDRKFSLKACEDEENGKKKIFF